MAAASVSAAALAAANGRGACCVASAAMAAEATSTSLGPASSQTLAAKAHSSTCTLGTHGLPAARTHLEHNASSPPSRCSQQTYSCLRHLGLASESPAAPQGQLPRQPGPLQQQAQLQGEGSIGYAGCGANKPFVCQGRSGSSCTAWNTSARVMPGMQGSISGSARSAATGCLLGMQRSE